MNKRLTANGRITNHEMGQLRTLDNPRKTRWNHVWCGVSNAFHPVSELDWTIYLLEREANGE
jgi:hypothetical protein